YWMDELNGFDDLDQLKLFFMAGCCGHLELFQHLFDDVFHYQHQRTLVTSTSTSTSASDISLSKVFSLIMFFAAKRGYQDIIDFIRSNVSITKNTTEDQQQHDSLTLDPTITTLSIYETLKHGHLQPFHMLTSLPNNDPTLQDCDAFLDDAVNHLQIIKFLFLEFNCHDLKYQPNQALWYASKNGSLQTVEFLLSSFPTPNPSSYKVEDSIEIAATNGHVLIVSLLLQYSKSDRFKINITRAVRNAVDNGDLDMVTMLLNAAGFTIWGDRAVSIAAREGHFDIVKLLVSNPRVDLAVSDLYESVKIALERGHDEIAKFLMLDPRLQECLTNGAILSDACMVGNVDVVKLALGMAEYSRNDINRFLLLAIEYGRLEIVKLLVEVPGVDVTTDNNVFVRQAASGGCLEIVQFLLNFESVDVTAEGNEAIINAARNGHADVVKVLIEIAGVDATASHNEALKMAVKGGHVDVVRLLLEVTGYD
ncbi:hypothetical protein HDU76_010912, partial [Blyttiomyces sp. JEL0837]